MDLNKELKKNIDLTGELQQFSDAVLGAARFQDLYVEGMQVSNKYLLIKKKKIVLDSH